MHAGKGVLAVVCPGRDAALPVTGRRWSRTVLSRTRRGVANLRGPFGAAQDGHRGGATSQTVSGQHTGTAKQAIRQPCSASSACDLAGVLPLAAVIQSPDSGRADNDKRYRHHHPASQTLGSACRYLSLKFQTIQSCSPVRGPIATAVQPWCPQNRAYKLLKSPCSRFRVPSNLHLGEADGHAPV